MDDSTFLRMQEAQQLFHPTAMRIPGVHATSIGLKRVGGTVTETFAICVHTERKRPLAEVPADERIPTEIAGFPTDVLEQELPEPQEDGSKRRPVLGGIQIAAPAGWGTLGCIVRDRTDGAACALSNQHVLTPNGGGVFQPKADPVCDQIGNTKRVVLSDDVDGGIASLDKYDVTAVSQILDIGNVTGTHRVTWAELPCPVRKRGRTTLLTAGRITNLSANGIRSDGWRYAGQQLIQPDHVPFSDHGDSGSAVVDGQGRVVGLLWGGGSALSMASPIQRVIEELQVDVATASSLQSLPDYRDTTVGRLEALLSESARGRAYWRTFRRYRHRVRHLFHENPRLYATWLKIPRSALVETTFAAIANPDAEIPAAIGGWSTVDLLARLRDGVVRHLDDAALTAQLDALRADIAGNVGRTWRQALQDRDATVVAEG